MGALMITPEVPGIMFGLIHLSLVLYVKTFELQHQQVLSTK
jgi:hypothetical protein